VIGLRVSDVLRVIPLQAKAMLATVRPRDIAGKTGRRSATEEFADLSRRREDQESHRRTQDRVVARGSRLRAEPTWGWI
jgi:hypothetical protein